jgi:hypothetical protein
MPLRVEDEGFLDSIALIDMPPEAEAGPPRKLTARDYLAMR